MKSPPPLFAKEGNTRESPPLEKGDEGGFYKLYTTLFFYVCLSNRKDHERFNATLSASFSCLILSGESEPTKCLRADFGMLTSSSQ
jgi:hypothetical protein